MTRDERQKALFTKSRQPGTLTARIMMAEHEVFAERENCAPRFASQIEAFKTSGRLSQRRVRVRRGRK